MILVVLDFFVTLDPGMVLVRRVTENEVAFLASLQTICLNMWKNFLKDIW